MKFENLKSVYQANDNYSDDNRINTHYYNGNNTGITEHFFEVLERSIDQALLIT